MSIGLPIMPARFTDESMTSWLKRIGSVYKMTPNQLLDEWLSVTPKHRGRLPVVESRINASTARLVAPHLRIPESEIASIIAEPSDWILETEHAIPVCAECLKEDDKNGQPRYHRKAWYQCWRGTCPVHRTLLFTRTRYNRVAAEPKLTRKARISASTLTYFPYTGEKIPNISSNDFEILRQVRQIETAITRAHAGKRPNPESWGALRASEFIVVVRDVATFMMTNFGEKRLAPIGLADTHQLSKLAPQGSFRTHETLYHGWRDDVGPSFLNRSADVAFTRTILFWVREIMHRHSGRPWLNYDARHGRIRRQARILERQCSRGLEWLSERMRDWPDQYRETWWAGARLVGIPT